MFGASHKAAKRQLEQLEAIDLSQLLRNPSHVKFLPSFAQFGIGSELTAFCHDPALGLLAVGTAQGRLCLFGDRAVQTSWSLGHPVKIKHMTFQQGRAILCCVDAKDTLTCFDLSTMSNEGVPERMSTISMRSAVTCIESSPLHSHILLGGKDGSVDVFDVDRGRLVASSRIHNCWLQQEELLRRSGVPYATSSRHVPMCVDVRHSPIDVNTLLIAYEHGVLLWNIAEQRITGTFDFVLPPGAPGGGNTDENNLFSERRLGITCVAWRPDGLVFAVGHDDGSISLASPEDELPLTIRTIEREDVHKATEADLFGTGPAQDGAREPIFKLSWTGRAEQDILSKAWSGWNSANEHVPETPQASESSQIGTCLLVMGGLLPADPVGVTIMALPDFVEPAGEKTTSKGTVAASFREALRESLRPTHLSVFPTFAPPEDFLVIAQASPRSTAPLDPSAVLVLSDRDSRVPVLSSPHADRGLEAFEFTVTRAPERLDLPAALKWSGPKTTELVKVLLPPAATYRAIIRQHEAANRRIHLSGGQAEPVRRTNKRPSRAQPRLLVSAHLDLVIRFWDASEALLDAVVDEAGHLLEEFPTHISHLDIDLKQTLLSPSAASLEASRLLVSRPWELEIEDFDFASESIEVAIRFNTGEIIVHRLQRAEVSAYDDPLADSQYGMQQSTEAALNQLNINSDDACRLELGDIIALEESQPVTPNDHFIPVAASSLSIDGPPSQRQLALSDVGFLAASSGSRLLVANLRGPEVLFWDSPFASSGKKGKGKSKPGPKETSPITSLTWTICPTNEDSEKSLRLLVTHATGSSFVFEVAHVVGEWILSDRILFTKHEASAKSFQTFVLDRLGSLLSASQSALQMVLAQQSQPDEQSLEARGSIGCLWITVSPTDVAVYMNVTGPKSASFEGRAFTFAGVVWNQGCPVLAVASQDGSITILSLPDLSFITKTQIPSALHSMKGRLSFADDGSILQVVDPLTIRLHLLFSGAQPSFPPKLSITPTQSALSAAGTALSVVSTTVSSWFGGQAVYTGAEVDAVLGGPDRPPPRFRQHEQLQSQAAIDAQKKVADKARARAAGTAASPPAPATWAETFGFGASSSTRPATREQTTQANSSSAASVMARANEALAQRGEYLSSIQESLANTANAAARYASDTKKAAQREAAKQSFLGMFK